MANALIVYGTTEGQTRKIADYISERMKAQGNDVTVCDATQIPAGLTPTTFDCVVVAASLHVGHHQGAVQHFVKHHRDALASRPCVFLSVSLSAAGDGDDQKDAWDCANKFLKETQWQPTYVHIVGGALRYTEYDFFRRWIMKRIAREKGAPTDTNRDVEYTDWAALNDYADQVLAAVTRLS
jgi:menaquinone-dependent protoporphyrinogen oxidase